MRSQRLGIAAILAIYMILGAIYSLVTPIFEPPDELSHYPVVKHIADGLGLPVQRPGSESLWQQEGSQPPAYYLLAAALTVWIDTDDLAAIHQLNPMTNLGNPLAPGNKNVVIHTDRESFPWQGTTLAVHLIRLLSLLLGAGTGYFTYRIAREIAPQRPDLALASAVLVVFNPMFLFISASVNNDNLVILLATAILWVLVRTLRLGWLTDSWGLLLGALLGGATLSKLSGLGLLPLTAVVLIWVAARRKAYGALLRWALWIGLPMLAISGWWYVRNWLLYGDPSGLNAMLDVVGRRPQPTTLRDLRGEFQGFRMSFWAVFGSFDILAWPWVYPLYDALVAFGALGWVGWVIRRRGRWPLQVITMLSVLVAWVVLVLLALIRWTSLTYASQGRLLFPAIGALAVLVAFGLAGWLPRRWQGRGLAVMGSLLFILAAAIPLTVITPAYAKSPILTLADVPADAQRSDVTHGGVLRLLAYELPQESVQPGQMLPVTAYWQLTAPTDRDLAVFVHLLGRGGEPAGQLGSYLGLGAYPLKLLKPGDIVRDTYQVPVAVTATAPSLLRVDVGLFDRADPALTGLSVSDAAGEEASGVIGTARLLPHAATGADVPQTPRFNLGGQAALVGFDFSQNAVQPGDTLPLTLFWQAQARMPEDYQVFVHLMGPDGRPVAQGDKSPLNGAWPTSAWEPGQTFRDDYAIRVPDDLAPGAYELRVGLYRLADFTRLPVQGPEDRVADSAIILGQARVQ